MDIEKDIQTFKSLGYKAIESELKVLEEEIRNKKYFFKVANLLNELNELIHTDFFKKHGVNSLKLLQGYDYDFGEVFSDIEILDNNNQSIHIYNDRGNYIIPYEIVTDLLDHNNFVLEEDLYNNGIDKKTLHIVLNENTKNVLKDYLLNPTLLKAYNYMEMLDKNPPKNSNEKSSKRKI